MPHEYIVDESGKKTAVVIPISEWEAIVEKLPGLRELTAKEKRSMSAFSGSISKETGQSLLKHLAQSRDEWFWIS